MNFFNILSKNKDEIENELGVKLEWERMDDKVTSRIKWQINDVSLYNDNDHGKMIDFLIESMIKMQDVFKKQVQFYLSFLSKIISFQFFQSLILLLSTPFRL